MGHDKQSVAIVSFFDFSKLRKTADFRCKVEGGKRLLKLKLMPDAYASNGFVYVIFKGRFIGRFSLEKKEKALSFIQTIAKGLS